MSEDPAKRRARRRLRKALGQCVDCGRSPSKGITRCAYCNSNKQYFDGLYRERRRERLAEKQRERSARWREEGRCFRCGAPLIEDEREYCMACQAGRHEPIIKGA